MASKLDRLARAKLLAKYSAEKTQPRAAPRERQEKEKEEQAQPRPSAGKSAGKKENAGALANKVHLLRGGSRLSADDLQSLKKQAVAKEREKRRAARATDVAVQAEELRRDKAEAIKRERASSKSGAQQLAHRRPSQILQELTEKRRRSSSASKDEILLLKEEATRREMKRERLRRKQQLLSAPRRPSIDPAEADQLRAAAVARERAKEARRQSVAPLASIDSLAALEEAFAELAQDGVLSVVEASKLARRSPFPLQPLRGLRCVSWTTLREHLASPEGLQQPKRTETCPSKAKRAAPRPSDRELKRAARDVVALCEATFASLAKHASDDRGNVRPSDLNAVLAEHTAGTARIVSGDALRLPALPVRDDAPVSWADYKRWLLEQLADDSVLGKAAVPPAPFAAASAACAVGAPNAEREENPVLAESAPESSSSGSESESETEAEASSQLSEAATPHAAAKDLEAVDKTIVHLQTRLQRLEREGQKEKCVLRAKPGKPNWGAHEEQREQREEGEDGWSTAAEEDSGSDADKAATSRDSDKDAQGEDGENSGNLYTGRCWLLCERNREEAWLNSPAASPSTVEWRRCREVCAEVRVSQLQNPFRMYLSVQLLRSGLSCVRRIGVDELSMLTAHSARAEQHQKVSLSKSGKHVHVRSARGDRFRCRSLGPEEWSREELAAAIEAEQSMRQWVLEGKIPRQSDFIQWLLLHCVVRVVGDELDPEEAYMSLWLPGDDTGELEGFDSGAARHNKVEVHSAVHSKANKTEDEGTTAVRDRHRHRHHHDHHQSQAKTKRASPSKSATKKSAENSEANETRRLRRLLVAALNKEAVDTRSAQEWFESTRSGLAVALHTVATRAEADLSRNDVLRVLRGSGSVAEALYSLVQVRSLVRAWKQRTRSLKVADVYDLFRAHQREDAPGRLSAEAFAAVVQDTLRVDVPEWQLVAWHHRHGGEYRAFIKTVYQAIARERDDSS